MENSENARENKDDTGPSQSLQRTFEMSIGSRITHFKMLYIILSISDSRYRKAVLYETKRRNQSS